MMYKIIKETVIDSINREQSVYGYLESSEINLITNVIPEFNKLVDIANKNYELIHSTKRILFKFEPIIALNMEQMNTAVNANIDFEIVNYNKNVIIANKRTRNMNKALHRDKDAGIIKEFHKRDFINPFVDYTSVHLEGGTGLYVALGRE